MNTPTMDHELSRMVADQAERLFADLATRDLLQTADAGQWPAQAWRQVAETGLALALVPEARGGAGLPAADGFLLARRAAWHALPLPLGDSLLARALWCSADGDSGAGPSADAAGAPWTLAATTPGGGLTLRQDGGAAVLHGSLHRVPWAAQAAHVLAWARDEAGAGHLILLPGAAMGSPGPARRSLANEPLADLSLDGVRLDAAQVRGAPMQAGPHGVHGLNLHGALLRAHQMVGAMERCLDFALDHANERVQFGRPISKFPAVQNLLVEAACETAAADASLAAATARWNAGRETDPAAFALAVAAAKARTGEAAGRVASLTHQVHGAMGFTQEHALHHFTRRLWSWRDEFGNEAFWQREIGRAVCAAGGDALWPMVADDDTGSTR